jgi:hypothetical protein
MSPIRSWPFGLVRRAALSVLVPFARLVEVVSGATPVRRLSGRAMHGVGWYEAPFDIVSVVWALGELPRIQRFEGVF